MTTFEFGVVGLLVGVGFVALVELFVICLAWNVKRDEDEYQCRREIAHAQEQEEDYYATVELALCRCGRLLRTDEDLLAASCGVCRNRTRIPRTRGAELTHARGQR